MSRWLLWLRVQVPVWCALGALLAVMTCCATNRVAPQIAAPAPKAIAMQVHVDVDMLQWQRECLSEAARNWREVSGGRIAISYSFDVDFMQPETLPHDGYVMVAITGDMPKTAELEDKARVPRGSLLGITFHPEGAPDVTLVLLVVDRLQNPLDLIGVAEHELWHAMGQEHYQYSNGVLSADHGSRVWSFTPQDRRACCEVGLCLVGRLGCGT